METLALSFNPLIFGLYLVLGICVGILAGLLGVGGGLIIVPILIWSFSHQGFAADLVVHLAVGSSLATIVVTSLVAIRFHQRRKAVSWLNVWQLTPGLLAGAFFGSFIADLLPTLWLQRAFALFALFVAWSLLTYQATDKSVAHTWSPPMLPAGIGIGVISALVGIGGGTMTVPLLHSIGLGMRQAVATSSACGLPIAVAGTIGFIWQGWHSATVPVGSSGFIYWPAVIGITLASSLSAPFGVKLAHRLPVSMLRRSFGVLLLLVSGQLLLG